MESLDSSSSSQQQHSFVSCGGESNDISSAIVEDCSSSAESLNLLSQQQQEVTFPGFSAYSSSPYAFPYQSLMSDPSAQQSLQLHCQTSPAEELPSKESTATAQSSLSTANAIIAGLVGNSQNHDECLADLSIKLRQPYGTATNLPPEVQRIANNGKLNLKRYLNSGNINDGKAKFSPVRDQYGKKIKLRHYCAVRSCPVTEHSRKPGNREKYSFYRIPPRERDPIRREVWLRAIRPDNPDWDSKWGRVCERHFPSGNPGKTGIPTRFLDPDYPGDLDPHGITKKVGRSSKKSVCQSIIPKEEEIVQEDSVNKESNADEGNLFNEHWRSRPDDLANNLETFSMESNSLGNVQEINGEDLAIKVEEDNTEYEEPSPASGSSPPGFCTMHDDTHLAYLANRISNFRSMIGQLQDQLNADESELSRLCPDHPMLCDTVDTLCSGSINNTFQMNRMIATSVSSSGSQSQIGAKKRKLLPALRSLYGATS